MYTLTDVKSSPDELAECSFGIKFIFLKIKYSLLKERFYYIVVHSVSLGVVWSIYSWSVIPKDYYLITESKTHVE